MIYWKVREMEYIKKTGPKKEKAVMILAVLNSLREYIAKRNNVQDAGLCFTTAHFRTAF